MSSSSYRGQHWMTCCISEASHVSLHWLCSSSHTTPPQSSLRLLPPFKLSRISDSLSYTDERQRCSFRQNMSYNLPFAFKIAATFPPLRTSLNTSNTFDCSRKNKRTYIKGKINTVFLTLTRFHSLNHCHQIFIQSY